MAISIGHNKFIPVALSYLRSVSIKVTGAVLLLLAVLLGLALWSFDHLDPSLNQTGTGPVKNFAGKPGAAASELLIQLFGYAAWAWVVLPLCWGARLLFRFYSKSYFWMTIATPLAIMGWCAFLAPMGVASLHAWPFHAGLGGMVGDITWKQLNIYLTSPFYPWVTLGCALLFSGLALGLTLSEMPRLFSNVRHSAKHVGRNANIASHYLATAANTASESSRRWVNEQIELMEKKRRSPRARSFEPDDELGDPWMEPEPVDEKGRSLVQHLRDMVPFQGEQAVKEDTISTLEPDLDIVPIEEDLPHQQNPVESVRKKGVRPAKAPEKRRKGRSISASQPVIVKEPGEDFEMPGDDLLTPPRHSSSAQASKAALREMSVQLESVLDDFGVKGAISDAKPGPVVTLYELEPAPGTRSQRVVSLSDDIARSLCALSVRVATVPGRNIIGIELPNDKRRIVFLKELMAHESFAASEARLALALGMDISGRPIVVDLARMPHLLIAGTTGSGKSVAINGMILSLLYKLTPDQCRIIMIDPKVIELSVYEGIPHLLAPVVTEPTKAVMALKWVVRQMDDRYRLMSLLGVRDIFAFNKRLEQARARGDQLTRNVRTGFDPQTGEPIFEEQPIDMTPLPLIVVIVDEVADLMLTAGKEIENAIQRLSQKARAAGIHLIVATQRPSVDVLTGVIKANLPSRISFRVSSKIDSRTILGEPGAEQLLGQGDMLYMMPGDRIIRVHGPLVSDHDVERVVTHLRTQGTPEYDEEVTSDGSFSEPAASDGPSGGGSGGDSLYEQAIQIVARDKKASTSYLQRKLSIGYNSAAKLIERMEAEGLISTADHVGRRKVLMGKSDPMDMNSQVIEQ